MIDWDKPVQTRDGMDVKIYTTEGQASDCPVVGEYLDIYGRWRIRTWNLDGESVRFPQYGLVNVPEKQTLWLNINSDWESGYTTRHKADRLAAKNRIACVEVTFTNGDGLESSEGTND